MKNPSNLSEGRMSDQPKPATGEWTVFGTSVQVNGEALFHCSTRKDAEIASLEHNAALAESMLGLTEQKLAKQLATERERHGDEMTSVQLQLNKQLAAEREKVQHVVALLENPKFDDWDRQELLKALHLTGVAGQRSSK